MPGGWPAAKKLPVLPSQVIRTRRRIHSALQARLRERYHEFMMTEWPSCPTIPDFGGVRSVGWLERGGCAQTTGVRELSVESLWVAGEWGLRTGPDRSRYKPSLESR